MKLSKPAFVSAPILFSILFSISAQAALYTRDLDGNLGNGHEGVYDDVLDITWLADANLPATNNFGISNINSDSSMSWYQAHEFVNAVNASNSGAGYLGFNSWRLPNMSPILGYFATSSAIDGRYDEGFNISAPVDPLHNPWGKSPGHTGSELAYHYYNNLGGVSAAAGELSVAYWLGFENSGLDDAVDTSNHHLFQNMQTETYSASYVYGTEFPDIPGVIENTAYRFSMENGQQGKGQKGGEGHVWMVIAGDVGAAIVPIPAAAWLFGSGLIGLLGIRRIVQ